MNILIVVGARPNFMKVAPIIAAIKHHNQLVEGAGEKHSWLADTIEHTLVHTGQHYDDLMSVAFFRDLNLPKPDVDLGVGSGSHAAQTAEIMKKFEPVLRAEKPDVVLVVGDVNSTLACALVAAKISFDSDGSRPLIAHVESGLRSFDRTMPEEINRIITDQLADMLFVTEESAMQNLRQEGVPFHKIHFVGNTMIDSLLAFREKSEESSILDKLGLRTKGGPGAGSSIRPYAVLTLHRPSNVDNSAALSTILHGLKDLADTQPLVFPAHPRTRRRMEQFGIRPPVRANENDFQPETGTTPAHWRGLVVTEPLGYLDFLCLMSHAALVITDSGGIQEETTCLGIPCVTVRENTERPVTVEMGTNVIAGTGEEKIKTAIRHQLGRKMFPQTPPEKWDGQASSRIVLALARAHNEVREPQPAISAEHEPTSPGALETSLP